MIEILPIKAIHQEDQPVFGTEALLLSKLAHFGMLVVPGIVVTPPVIRIKTLLRHWDFSNREIIEQSLTIIKKDLKNWPVPEILIKEAKDKKMFLVGEASVKSVQDLWKSLLDNWMDAIKQKMYLEGFNQPVTDSLEPQIIFFIDSIQKAVNTYIDEEGQLCVEGKVDNGQLEKLKGLTLKANNALIIPHKYRWVVSKDIKLVGVDQYIPENVILIPRGQDSNKLRDPSLVVQDDTVKTTVKLFYDLSESGLVVDRNIDGIFLDSGKIFDLEKKSESFEELVFKLVESAATFRSSPILFKLADVSEKWGGVRGTLRLLHQKSLLRPLTDALIYARNKRGHHNIHLVIPYARGVLEFEQLKRELASKKLIRKNSLNIWLEADLPENLINIEDYIESGIDGIILNIDEIASHLLGFDYKNEEVLAYKSEAAGLLKFLVDSLRTLHKLKKPFIAMGRFCLEPEILSFLVDKGVYGLILPKFEIHSASELVQKAEKKAILSRVS